ncbi:cytochrome P450 oxidoreductase protein [Rutstroemia sp. NJR-2017a BVV2]|nr:cytochrome P450 oxidoreductase protein [Rutstroemia sp. NJR-2017a BVV2]
MASLILLPAICVVAYVLNRLLFGRRKSEVPLPPGPKSLPLIGNINDLPPSGSVEFKHWLKHKDCYGPISSVTVLGQTIIILHGREIASELMEKRANIHSGRPKMKFGFDMSVPFAVWDLYTSSTKLYVTGSVGSIQCRVYSTTAHTGYTGNTRINS